MKKALLYTFLIFNYGYMPIVLAQTCQGTLKNLYFSGVVIDKNKNVSCNYRYCYYNCIFDHYDILGQFKPIGTQWEKDDQSRWRCASAFSNECQFEYDNQMQK